MSHRPPPVPPEQRSTGPASGEQLRKDVSGDVSGEPTQGRRDESTGAQSSQPGDADVNTDEQGRFGDIKQNTTHQGFQQDR